jgi:hypothetical protein
VEHSFRFGHRPNDFIFVADVGDDAREAGSVARLQPFEIAFDARSRKCVVNEDFVSLACQPIGKVAADETGTAGDQDWPVIL